MRCCTTTWRGSVHILLTMLCSCSNTEGNCKMEKISAVVIEFQQNSSQTFFSPHTNSIINPISFLPMPNVTLCLSYSWLRAESVGFGQKNVNRSTLGYGWPSCVSASRLIKKLSTPYIWPKTRSSRADTVHKRLSLSSAWLLPDSNIPHWVWRENTTSSRVVETFWELLAWNERCMVRATFREENREMIF